MNSMGSVSNEGGIGNFPLIFHRPVRMASVTDESKMNNTFVMSILLIS